MGLRDIPAVYCMQVQVGFCTIARVAAAPNRLARCHPLTGGHLGAALFQVTQRNHCGSCQILCLDQHVITDQRKPLSAARRRWVSA